MCCRKPKKRLPRKLLLRETGKTLIQHTYEAALRAKLPAGVIVATDHEEIFREVESLMLSLPPCTQASDARICR